MVIAELLGEICNELRLLRAELSLFNGRAPAPSSLSQEEQRGGVLRAGDFEKLCALLPAIVCEIGESAFSIRSINDHARAIGDRDLCAALGACGSRRASGKLLKRAAGLRIRELELCLIGTDPNIFIVRRRKDEKG